MLSFEKPGCHVLINVHALVVGGGLDTFSKIIYDLTYSDNNPDSDEETDR